MRDHRRDTPPTSAPDAGLTQTLKQLRIPTHSLDQSEAEQPASAMVVCRDAASRKWAPRWLQEAGFRVLIPEDHRTALTVARDRRPDVVLVEAGLTGSTGESLYKMLLDASDVDVPVFVLCNNAREVAAAHASTPFDIARKPFEWQLIARRARNSVDLYRNRERLAESESARSQALELADYARERLRSREMFEPVTGLPNKSKFIDLLGRGMAAVDRDGNKLAVFVVGFNRFRLVVEAMGQEHADLVIAEVGNALSVCLRETDRGDTATRGIQASAAASIDQFRFAVMFSYSGDETEVQRLRERMLETLGRPIQVGGQTIYLSACLGIAVYPGDAEDVDSLLQRADNAMRDAQSRGGGFKYYCTETDAAAARKLRIEHMLHEALDNGELTLAYQPINRVSDGAAIAAEALLRWPQPDGGFIAPDVFVPVAEESGLMVRLGRFVLDTACSQLVDWRNAGIDLPYISINVSRMQLAATDFVAQVRYALKSSGLPAASLELELSERGVLSGDTDLIAQLHELKGIGVRLAIDDFGTGDSAIAYLKDLPVDVLKIDRSYIRGITHGGKEAAIASAMVALGQNLGLTVVAEGVETEEQLAMLRELDCNAYQGYLVSRPADADTIAGFVIQSEE